MTTEQAKDILDGKMTLRQMLDEIPELKELRGGIDRCDILDSWILGTLCAHQAYKHMVEIGEIPVDKIYNARSGRFDENYSGDIGFKGNDYYRFTDKWEPISN